MKRLGFGVLGIVVLIGVANLVMAWYYQDHFYPNTKAGDVKIAGMSQSRAYQVLIDRADRQPLVVLIQDKEIKIPTKDLGVVYDIKKTITQLNQQPKPVLPMLAWLPGNFRNSTPISYQFDQAKFNKRITQLSQENATEAQNANLEIKNGSAKIIAHKPGAQFDQSAVAGAIKSGLAQLSDDPVVLPVKKVEVELATDDLQPALRQANDRLSTKITLSYEDKDFIPSRSEIGSWLELNDQHAVVVSGSAVATYIEQVAEEIDVAVKNEVITMMDGVEISRQAGQPGRSLDRADTSQAMLQALEKSEDTKHQLKVDTVEPTVEYIRKFSFSSLTYSYCVQANAVSESMLDHFAQKITSTLADSRGWGMDGRIQFNRVASGCNFNLVLAAASTLPGYSSGCSIYWSCRVGSNVIINVDRWVGASDSWNNAGGSLDEYQSMVINHEVGHWLGFDHWSCGGPGQAAPVMLQQSIDLQGCTFNVWPTSAELNSLRSMKGI